MRLGLVTYNWGAKWDLPTLIRNCEAAGYRGVELRTTHEHGVEPSLSKTERREVAKRFADSGVELVGLGSVCEYHSADPAELKRNIEETEAFVVLAHDLGASGVKVRPNALVEGVPQEKTIEQIGKTLRKVAEFAEGYGMQIRLEVHGVKTQEPELIRQMMEIADHDYARVCWNCNSTDARGKGLKANFELLRPYFGEVVHVHSLKTKPRYPWKEFYSLLKESNYDGWTLLEDGKVPDDIIGAMNEFRKQWEQFTN